MATPVSEFYAKIGIDVDKKSLKGVDKFFGDLEKRMGGLGTTLSDKKKGATKAIKDNTSAVDESIKVAKQKVEADKKVATQATKTANTVVRASQKETKALQGLLQARLAYIPENGYGGDAKDRTRFYTRLFGKGDNRLLKPPVAATPAKVQARGVANLAEIIDKRLGVKGSVTGGLSRGDRQRQYNSIFGINSTLNRVSGRTGKSGNILVNLANREADVESGKYAREWARKQKEILQNKQAAAKKEKEAAMLSEKNQKEAARQAQKREREEQNRLNREANNRKIAERERLKLERIAKREEEKLRKAAERARVSEARIKRANYLAMGGAGGALARYGLASLPFVGGMYGLSSLNRANQTLMSTEISSGAIFGNRADEARNWLKQHSNYVGYNYLETMPIFSQFMAAGMNSMGYDKSLGIFEGFSEFGRTRGADKLGMQRGLRAVSQMASKGKITAEELNYRLAA